MTFSEIKELLESKFKEAIIGEDLDSTPKAILLESTSVFEVCRFLHSHDSTYFDQLVCITGIDNGPDDNSMEVVYNLYSIPTGMSLMLKSKVDRQTPTIMSVVGIWKTANWLERETFDLLGIQFEGHPDLRRILLPKDWEGYPLRKDYKEQERYHGMSVVYDRDEEAHKVGS